MELVRVTEAAAMSAARFLGRGDKHLVDEAAVTAMRNVLGFVRMDGIVVIGEGEKDEAPMLYIGEKIGDGSEPKVDIAVDPVDGTTLTARGLPGAISVVALSARGTMHCPRNFVYMNKIVADAEAKDCIDINAPVAENLKNIATAKKKKISEVTVVVLDRPRHEKLLDDIRRRRRQGKADFRWRCFRRYRSRAAGDGCRCTDGCRGHAGGRAFRRGDTLYRRRYTMQSLAPR